jgi:hypothetical protein
MNWNQNVLLLFGALLGAAVCAVGIAFFESSGTPFDLDAAGKLASILVAPFTLGLVALSWVLARETRQTWVQNRTPNVVVTIESSRVSLNHMQLVIENVGGGPAYDLSITFDPDLELQSGQSKKPPRMISSIPLLRFPILKPRQSLTTYLAAWGEINPKRTHVTATYRDADGETHTSINEIDLSRFEGTGPIGTEPLLKIAEETGKIRSAVEQLASGFKRLNVDIHTAQDRVEERKQQEAWLARQQRRNEDKKNDAPDQASGAPNDSP